ncbi:MAG: LOG family protein [Candidatus Nanopelagicales bacterium]
MSKAQAHAVCVFCASSSAIDERYLRLAAELGTTLAGHGISLVTGGGSVSMMGAIARATRASGGHTVGVIPSALVDMEVADHEADELIVTPDMRTRKAEMDRRADAFITLPGGIGTLEELTEVWTSFTLGMHRKPVIVIDPWGDYAHLRALIAHLTDSGFVRSQAAAALHWVTGVDQAMALLDSHLETFEGPTTTVDEALESSG